MIEGKDPGLPEPVTSLNPGIVPASACAGFDLIPVSKNFLSSFEIDAVNLFFLTVPYPTTTTSASSEASDINAIFTLFWLPRRISWEAYPVYEITRISPAEAMIAKSPRLLLWVPVGFPLMVTLTPDKGFPSSPDMIFPVIVFDCANKTVEISNEKTKRKVLSLL